MHWRGVLDFCNKDGVIFSHNYSDEQPGFYFYSNYFYNQNWSLKPSITMCRWNSLKIKSWFIHHQMFIIKRYKNVGETNFYLNRIIPTGYAWLDTEPTICHWCLTIEFQDPFSSIQIQLFINQVMLRKILLLNEDYNTQND